MGRPKTNPEFRQIKDHLQAIQDAAMGEPDSLSKGTILARSIMAWRLLNKLERK